MKKENRDFDEHELDALIQEAMADDLFIAVPEGFADRMEEKAKRMKLYGFWQEELLKQASLLGGVIIMLVVAFGVLYYFQPESLSGIISFLSRFKWLIFGGISFLFALQLTDSWVMKKTRLY